MDQADINDAEWNDPANWRWGVYRSARDTRVWVSKKPEWMGWTLNFAHRASAWWMVALLTPALVTAAVAIWLASRG